MARYDLYPMPRHGRGYLLDIQADLLDRLDTRVVVPLFREEDAPPPMAGLNPVFQINGHRHVMLTQSIATIRRRDLGKPVLSLDGQHDTITAALDFLLSGI
ncbi:CcdB family protein [Niveispirillum fermenti]|uniref:CcdB family protein n=1 Tax=Niveispirillum fermenti TaxID=1233113 RepID=UPI003A84BC36